jgi:tyrosine-protein kinase Etk/Wzc
MDAKTPGDPPAPAAPRKREPDEADLIHYVRVVRKHPALVGGSVLGAVLLAGAACLVLPRTYEARATLLPAGKNSPRVSALLSNLGGLADLAGLGQSLPEEGADFLVNVLESRTLAERVVEREKLLPILYRREVDPATGAWKGRKPDLSEAVDRMRDGILSVSVNKRGMVSVAARFGDPDVAARIANAAVSELEEFLKRHQGSSSSRSVAFLERRKKEVAEELRTAEEALRRFCETNGVVSMPDQTRLLFEQIAALATEIATRRAKLEVAETFGGASNPEAGVLRAEILSLEKELRNLERGARTADGVVIDANGFIPLYEVPEKSLQVQRLLRETKVKQEVYAFLQTEFEAARIRQAREEISFTLLDAASRPARPVRPRPLPIVGLSAVFAGLGAFLLASFLERLGRAREAGGGAVAG